MATGSHKTNVDTAGNPVRVVTNASADSSAEQQVVTLGDKNGNLLDAPATSSVTQVTSAAASTVLKAASTTRIGLTVMNDSTAVLYLLMGSGTASATNYSVKMAAGAYWEAPFGWAGDVKGIWASANGFGYVTELSA